MRAHALIVAVALAGHAGCVADDAATDDDATEDLGALGGKADAVLTRDLVLHAHRQSGEPSTRTYTITTADSFRVSLAYDTATATRLVVSDGASVVDSTSIWQPTVLVPAAAAPRQLKIRIENPSADALPVRFHVATATPRPLRVATFNIRWYGLDGSVDAPKPEHRNPTLRAFLAANLADADVIAFEEIADVAQFEAEVKPAGWTCHTYDNATVHHQFVVVCHAPQYTLTREPDDDNFAYEPLALGTLRPAVSGVLRDAATGAPLAHLLGVHLKALPDSTATRLDQAEILAKRIVEIDARGEQLPTVLLGDFNAHRATVTGLAADDWTLIDDVFASHAELALDWVDYPFANSFRDKTDHGYRLDHVWVERATATGAVVAGPCNLPWETGQAAIAQHYDDISDHCPVIATLAL